MLPDATCVVKGPTHDCEQLAVVLKRAAPLREVSHRECKVTTMRRALRIRLLPHES